MTFYEINLDALYHNITMLREKSSVPIWGVLKYDGYGVGLLNLARALVKCGVDRFAVSTMEEALSLRKAHFQQDILLLGPQTDDRSICLGLENGVIFSVPEEAYLMRLSRLAGRMHRTARAHLAVDTGLGRFGYLPGMTAAIRRAYSVENVHVEGIYTHFASGWDEKKTAAQLRLFRTVLKSLELAGVDRGMAHAAGSAAFFRCPAAHLDAVRLGSALVGRPAGVSASAVGLKNVGTLVTNVAQVRTLPKGWGVGYGGEARLHRTRTVAILNAGFWQGVPVRSFRQKVLHRYPTAEIMGLSVPIISSHGAGHAVCDVTGLDVCPGDEARIEINPLYLSPIVEKSLISREKEKSDTISMHNCGILTKKTKEGGRRA